MIVSPPTVSEITCGSFTRYLTPSPFSLYAGQMTVSAWCFPCWAKKEHLARESLRTHRWPCSRGNRSARARLGGTRLAVAGPLHRPLHGLATAQTQGTAESGVPRVRAPASRVHERDRRG